MNRKASILVVVVFVLGIVLGALGLHVAAVRGWTGPVPAHKSLGRAQMVEQITRELGLSPDQQEQLEAVLAETRGKYNAIYEQVRPQMEQARQEGRERIRKFLTAEQNPKFEEMMRRLDEERRKREHR